MAVIGSLDILIGASTGALSKGFKKAESMAQAFSGRVSKFMAGPAGIGGAIAGAIGGITIAGTLKHSVSQFMEVETAAQKLTSTLKASGGTAGVTAQAVLGLGQQLAQSTRYSATATVEAAAALAKFQQVRGGNFNETIKQAQNYATVMGKDLPGAATELGHALQNPKLGYLDLAKAGVQFSESQIDAIQSLQDAGDMAGAQKVILEALQAQYGGAAEAAGDTLGGKLDILKNSFDSITAAVGEGVMPAVSGALDVMHGWLAALDLAKIKSTVFEWTAKAIGFIADGIQVGAIAWKIFQVGMDTALLIGIRQIQLMVEGIEYAVNALRELAGFEKVALGSKDIKAFGDGMQKVMEKDADAAIKAIDAPWASTKVDKFFSDMKSQGESSAQAVGEAIKKGPVAAMNQLTEKQIESQTEATKLIDQLKLDVKYFGMDDKQRKVAELKDKGATKGQVEQLTKLSHQLKGKEIAEDVMMPFERFQRDMKRLKETRDAGGIDENTFVRARMKMVKGLQDSMPQMKVAAGGAMLAGSSEARSAVLSYQQAGRNANPVEALKRLEEMHLDESKMQTKYLRDLVKGTPSIAAFAGI